MPDLWLRLLFVAGPSGYIVSRRFLGYLRYFQQEGYEPIRFFRWTKLRSLTDPALWLSMLAGIVLPSAPIVAALLFATVIVVGLVQPNARRSGKIPLRLTARARRILGVSLLLAFVLWTSAVRPGGRLDVQRALIALSFLLAFSPVTLVAANALLVPYERHVQGVFEADARSRVSAIEPFIIGITGSYGKSSSKGMLAHILQFHAPTLAASGSINTLMGITRHIRENLVHGHKYMVVEMGAFKRGSIQRLCELTPPSAGLITAVGDMHLERFGSTEEIVRAKSELAQALPRGGLLVVNADSEGALRIAKGANQCKVILYGERSVEDLDVRVSAILFSRRGTTFELQTKTRRYRCFTPLLGRPIILNLAGVFALTVALGLPEDLVVAAMRTLEPVSNRLEVVEDGDLTWIKDAYNSNQFGFRAALEVASALPARRRFLITPGVVELGAQQFSVNKVLAYEASTICDRTVVVSQTNREAFIEGCREAGREDRLIPVANRTEAFRWIRDTAEKGDVVILENDLPDLYEHVSGFFWPTRSSRVLKAPQS